MFYVKCEYLSVDKSVRTTSLTFKQPCIFKQLHVSPRGEPEGDTALGDPQGPSGGTEEDNAQPLAQDWAAHGHWAAARWDSDAVLSHFCHVTHSPFALFLFCNETPLVDNVDFNCYIFFISLWVAAKLSFCRFYCIISCFSLQFFFASSHDVMFNIFFDEMTRIHAHFYFNNNLVCCVEE